jgi:hypothetical protein
MLVAIISRVINLFWIKPALVIAIAYRPSYGCRGISERMDHIAVIRSNISMDPQV